MHKWRCRVSFKRKQIVLLTSNLEEECAYAYNCFMYLMGIEHCHSNTVLLSNGIPKFNLLQLVESKNYNQNSNKGQTQMKDIDNQEIQVGDVVLVDMKPDYSGYGNPYKFKISWYTRLKYLV